MREEILRMDRVTYVEQGVTELNHFCLSLYAGDIMGLIPINDTGLGKLFKLMTQNLSIHYGYIYYRGRMVNQWKQSDGSYNRIGVVQTQSGLADDLTVADNVFVMRHGFRKRFIQRKVLERQLAPFLEEIDVHLSADAVAGELSPYHRLVTEIVKAVVADCRLIVLVEPGTVIGDERLNRLHEIIRHYAAKGFSFLYVSRHFEEAAQICNHAAFMLNGQIAKVLPTAQTTQQMLDCFGIEKYSRLVKSGRNKAPSPGLTPAMALKGLRFGHIHGLDMTVAPGECVVVQDMNNRIYDDLVSILTGSRRPEAGQVLVNGKPVDRKSQRDIAIVQKMAADSMVFADMSYMDNLCFAMDHLVPLVWRRRGTREGIRRECAEQLGQEVFDMPVEQLSRRQRYELVYTRILLQHPKVAVCIQPFMHADMEHRMHIWTLMERLMDKGVAVVILAVNLADSLAFADRLIRIGEGQVVAQYRREEFGSLSRHTPWDGLWSGE